VKPPAAAVTATPTPPKPNLRSLALDIVEGKVFGSWEIRNPNTDLKLVFMVLLFCKNEDIPKDIGAIYEYMDRAGPRAINGMPTFFSCRFLTQAEFKEVCGYTQEIKSLRQSFLQPQKSNDEEPETNSTGYSQPASPESQLDSRGRSGSIASPAIELESSYDPASNRLRKLFKRKLSSTGFAKKTWT
jgi:hypothetical protein